MQDFSQYRILKPCGIDFANYQGGEIVAADQIPAGSLDSVTRLGLVEGVVAVEPTTQPSVSTSNASDPSAAPDTTAADTTAADTTAADTTDADTTQQTTSKPQPKPKR
jgi:hypothetical protein